MRHAPLLLVAGLLAALPAGAPAADPKTPQVTEASMSAGGATLARQTARGTPEGAATPGEAASLPTPFLKKAATRLPDLDPALRSVYEQRDWRPLWTDSFGLTERGKALARALRRADRHGLDPARYGVSETQGQGDLDLSLSAAALRLARDLRGGTLSTRHKTHLSYPAQMDGEAILDTLAAADDPVAILYAASSPDSPLYEDLVTALARYREIAAAGGWASMPEGDSIEIGDDRPAQVPALRRRLLATGDLPAAALAATSLDWPLYDPRLEDAVRRFQDRHGLTVDGVVGPRTRTALNVPVEERIRTILLNLDRLRWLPDSMGRRHVLVNIAGFEVMVFEDGRPILRSAIIVGKRHQETPAFSDTIEHVVFNPYWNVPKSITVQEIAPKAAEDPSYIFREDMEVVTPEGRTISPYVVDWQAAARGDMPYRLRQRPGPQNSLGRVKILFPNDFAVYLHDTPAKSLFSRRVRAFSHGCMRVEKPFALAAELLGWPEEKVMQHVQSGDREWVRIDRPTPVHVTYLTAWVDPETGTVQFRDDLYGRDRDLRAQVARLPTMAAETPPPAGGESPDGRSPPQATDEVYQ